MALNSSRSSFRSFQYYKKIGLRKFLTFFLIVLSLILYIYSQRNPAFLDIVRAKAADIATPVVRVFTVPVNYASDLMETTKSIVLIKAENERLKAENESLIYYRNKVQRLQTENASFRALLNFVPPRKGKSIGAKVIGTPSNVFVKSVLIDVGKKNGIKNGAAVISQHALAGQVVQVGQHSARVLLVTDINSRVPVLLEGTRDRALLRGDNSKEPYLVYLSPKARPEVGQLVVTSGHGGRFAQGLVVGAVSRIVDDKVYIKSQVAWGKMDDVRVFDFGLGNLLALDDGEKKK
ncbi:MAG: rod shape-determining protein MreC [Alphaproteobacteria bacterium]